MTDRLQQIVENGKAGQITTRQKVLQNRLIQEKRELRQHRAAEAMPALWRELKEAIKKDCEQGDGRTFIFYATGNENTLRVYSNTNYFNLKLIFDVEQGKIVASCFTADPPEQLLWRTVFVFGLYDGKPFLFQAGDGEEIGPYDPFSASGELLERTLYTEN